MQNSILLNDAQVRPVGISLREGLATLKCETKRLLQTKSETMSFLCEETVTYGDVVKTFVGLVVVFALMAISGFMEGGEL